MNASANSSVNVILFFRVLFSFSTDWLICCFSCYCKLALLPFQTGCVGVLPFNMEVLLKLFAITVTCSEWVVSRVWKKVSKRDSNSKAIQSSSNCEGSSSPFWSKFGLRARGFTDSRRAAKFKVLPIAKQQRNESMGAPRPIEYSTW